MSANGQLSEGELSPIAGGTQLRNDAAAAWNAMAARVYQASQQRITINGPDSAYRTYARQVFWRNYWCARGACQNAAVPGTSNHGWGVAVDIPPATRSALANHGSAYGWRRECTDAPWEDWHWKWCGGWSGHNPGPGYGGGEQDRTPTLRKGDKGGAVERLQSRLRIHNCGIIRPEADGDFGERTADAVRQFQTTHNLKSDGIAGDHTWHKLQKRNPLTESESSHVNRLRLLERGDNITDEERGRIHWHRKWLARRRDWMKAKPDGWWDNKRSVRFEIVKREAGDA